MNKRSELGFWWFESRTEVILGFGILIKDGVTVFHPFNNFSERVVATLNRRSFQQFPVNFWFQEQCDGF